MARTRSPGYPAIGLKEAISKVEAVYGRDYQNRIPRKVAAEHMGYASLNGKSLGVLSALIKFGLLEGRGDETRVSDEAMKIIAHPPGVPERAAALRNVAALPELFSELDKRFQGGKASDQAIRSYLLTQKFIPAAADSAIRAYRETKQLVEAESAGYSPPDETETGEETAMETEVRPSWQPPPEPGIPIPSKDPYRLTLSRGGLAVTGFLTDDTAVDELIQALNAWKVLVKPQRGTKSPEPSSAASLEPARVSLIITAAQREELRKRGHTDEEIRGMTPEQAHEILGIFF